MLLRYHEIAACLGLEPQNEDRFLTSAVTDSREVRPGALFVCIKGEHVDGHDFTPQAEKSGASAILASRALPLTDTPVLQVPDTIKALGRIAAHWRGSTQARVTGVTGTAGKTTLKELLAQLLSTHGKTARNALNYNNQIGMPRAMLATDGDEDFWVMEAGISREGDMEELGEILRPDLGLILNVGSGHTEGLGRKGVAAHKATLLRNLSSGGRALISADYPDLVREVAATGAQTHFFSVREHTAQYYAAYEGLAHPYQGSGPPHGLYRICLDGTWMKITTPFSGKYNAENCIAAAAAAHMLGLSCDEIAAGLACIKTPEQRFSHKRLGQWDIFDDTYNANPLSMRRMLEASRELAKDREFVPVLGEMRELGDMALEEHEKLGRYLADLTPTGVIWKGGYAENILAGLRKKGYAGPFFTIRKREEFMSVIRELLNKKETNSKGGVILFKGSRANKLEEELAEFHARYGSNPDTTHCAPGEGKNVL
jgi:UDP-N-acetylmuramoyl-tripeptide--D-alanyl-D-alanine ligase